MVDEAPAPSCHPEELLGLGRMLDGVDPERAWACYHMALERGLRSPARERLVLHLARHEKRRARWEEARRLWESAIAHAGFDPRPWEELAKMYEHRLRDLERARIVVEEALARARAHAFPAGVLASFDHRLARLLRRAARAPGDDAARAREAG
jgi:tetratricopeptide (TPR) repeat protein